MPKGQGWGAEIYVGAQSLKSFKLPDGRVALSESVVTGQRDESGRGGIRRTNVDIMQPGEYQEELLARLRGYPEPIQKEFNRKMRFGEGRRIPRSKGDGQVVLSHPYRSVEAWQVVEALILKAAWDELDKRWTQGKMISFTTLALDYRDESQLVVIPEGRAGELKVESHPLVVRF